MNYKLMKKSITKKLMNLSENKNCLKVKKKELKMKTNLKMSVIW